MTATDDIDAAIARAQQAMEHPKKTKTNPHFKSSYADLADVVNAVRPALNAEGIAVIQRVEAGELVTEFRRNGEVRDSRLPLNLDAKPQELGSQMTYWRRFGLAALAGVAAEDDDDGNAASTAKPRQQRTAPAVNVDGEPLATKDQQGEFVALCDAQEFDKQDRADFVGNEVQRSAWKDVTKTEAAQLIDALKRDGWETFKDGGGKWHAVRAGQDAPFMDADAAPAEAGAAALPGAVPDEPTAHTAAVVESIEAQVAAAKARRAQDRVTEVASKGTKP
jgi:hypothetical protein